jgi:CXXX repeat peptide maturase
LSKTIEELYVSGKSPQFNLLSDRMYLDKMRNCEAGVKTITLAPDGKYYICPAFYYYGEKDVNPLEIKNPQLYKLEFAPICRRCDAFHCKRCVWLNKMTTLEVNTPSHEQCVISHIERNAAKSLLTAIRKHGTFLPQMPEIVDIDYLDPFDNIEK